MDRDDQVDDAVTASGGADGVRHLRIRVAGPPVFSRSICSLLGDTPWIDDVAPLTGKTGNAASAYPGNEELREVDVLLVAVPGTADLLRHLTEAREVGAPVPALALLTVGGHIFRSEMAVAGRLGIHVFLSVRDGADTLRGGVLAATRGEDYCSPDLRSLRKEIAQIHGAGR